MHPARKLCLSLAMILAPAFAMAEPIATIKKLSGDVSIIRGADTLPASLGARVHQHDRISTSAQGRIGLLFDDDSRLAAGPGSSLSLSNYSYDRHTRTGAIDVQVDEGTVSVIAGRVAEHNPDALNVSYPAASAVAIRGNTFSVKVDNSKKEGND
ncbi:hypothetical protein GCM10011352_00040 [Marinobacterium zhoushanense]|uniref:FecR protein domain-containing protein n=2 Tax=Marinobacterium zhoushanense TaxID=1679163 RepID=A0ABQ1JYM3_9GAMM|nr:hypothetical protein GCM10011352_00040 [Marinobacterium zhoushanense]